VGDYRHLKLSREGVVAQLRLSRPDVRNAFDDTVLEELTRAAGELGDDDSVRAVVLSGEGKVFCAGADINWMRRMVDYTPEENLADSRRLAAMLRALDRIPRPLVCRVHGVALGGGVGLLSVCDLVVAADDAVFGLSEVRLGIQPAVISPFVLRRLSQGVGRALFLTGERFGAERALRIGLVDRVVPPEALDDEVRDVVGELLKGGPKAQGRIKALIPQVYGRTPEDAEEITTRANAETRASDEGQEGLRSFLEKRRAGWIIES
jgi:methylglutaconyl-CoA hydratase